MTNAFTPLSGKEFEQSIGKDLHDKCVTKLFEINQKEIEFIDNSKSSISDQQQSYANAKVVQERILDTQRQYEQAMTTLFTKYRQVFVQRFGEIKAMSGLTKENIARYRKDSPVFKPFDTSVYMEHTFTIEPPPFKPILNMVKRMEVFDMINPKAPDMKSIISVFRDFYQGKAIVESAKKLLEIESTRGLANIDQEIARYFFPGYVPDYAKIYMEDMQILNKDAENAIKLLEKAKPEPILKMVENILKLIRDENSKMVKRMQLINAIENPKQREDAIYCYWYSINTLRHQLYILSIICVQYGIYSLIAFKDVLLRTDYLVNIAFSASLDN